VTKLPLGKAIAINGWQSVARGNKNEMFTQFTDRATRAIALAKQEAVQLRHNYVGTEHVLLGLVGEGSGAAADALRSLGVGASQLRDEIERLIQRGVEPILTHDPPLTPRATAAIEFATDEARSLQQAHVDAGHLLLGLLRERDGVAGRVLVNLGLKLPELREEVLKIRRAQMRIVERVVRPVRASAVRKRKMREELLAHFSGIYEREQARLNDPAQALKAAANRFGDPTALANELNSALPFAEKATYFINRNSGRRPQESVVRYMLRFAIGMTAFVAIFLFCCLIPVAFLKDGGRAILFLARPLAGSLPFMFIDIWILGMLYFKLRDAMCGAPWARKSRPLTIVWGALIAVVAFGTAIGFNAMAKLDGSAAASEVYISVAVSATAAIVFPIVACVSGPEEIGDEAWASLDLDTSAAEIAS
jgi:Clp amino terminal domain, pathogenicity island component